MQNNANRDGRRSGPWARLAFCALVVLVACALPFTLAWSGGAQHALNEFAGGKKAEPLRVTMTVQNRDGSVLADHQAVKGFTFRIQLATSTGEELEEQVGYTIYEPAANGGMDAAVAYAATRKVNRDFDSGVPVSTGTIAHQQRITLTHGQWLQTDRLPQGTRYRVEQVVEASYEHSADEPEGTIVAGGNQVDLLNVYDPTGITVGKTVANADGSALADEQKEQRFSFAVDFYQDGELVAQPHDYKIVDSDGTIVVPDATDEEAPGQTPRVLDGPYPASARSQAVPEREGVWSGVSSSSVADAEQVEPGEDPVPAEEAAEIEEGAEQSAENMSAANAGGVVSDAGATAGAAGALGNELATSSHTQIISLKANQRAIFEGLDPGMTFIVREVPIPESYAAETIAFSGEVRDGRLTPVAFTNIYNADEEEPDQTGSLHVGETVHRLQGELTDLDRAAQFAFELSFLGEDGIALPSGMAFAYQLFRYSDSRMAGLTAELDEQGRPLGGNIDSSGGSIRLSHGQVAVFDELPAGVHWQVVEHPLEGYTQWYKQLEGRIFAGQISRAPFNDEANERYVQIGGTKTWDLNAAVSADRSSTLKDLPVAASQGADIVADDILPGCITIRLIPRDGQRPVFEKTVYPDAHGRWQYVLMVPEFDAQGVRVDYASEYLLEEDPIEHFQSEVTGFDVKNTYIAPEEPTPPSDPNIPEDPNDPDAPEPPSDPDTPIEPVIPGGSSGGVDAEAPGASKHPAAGGSGSASGHAEQSLAQTGDERAARIPLLCLIATLSGALAIVSGTRMRREKRQSCDST